MFLKKKMNDSTNSYSDKILQIKEKMGEADAVVIGAGAGFSASAGFVYTGERFEKYFLDFRKKYSPLLAIRDAYPKMIIARTHHETYDYKGVHVVNICRWLRE